MPKYSVDIQTTHEFTYQVEADTEKEAEVLAMRMYNNDDAPVNEVVSDAVVLYSEEV